MSPISRVWATAQIAIGFETTDHRFSIRACPVPGSIE